jgi:hypothetical protein
MDVGHSHTVYSKMFFISVAQIPGAGMFLWLGHEQLYFFNKGRYYQEQKRRSYPSPLRYRQNSLTS